MLSHYFWDVFNFFFEEIDRLLVHHCFQVLFNISTLFLLLFQFLQKIADQPDEFVSLPGFQMIN